jgi:hypothetical protein
MPLPMSASSLLKTQSPRKNFGTGTVITLANKFSTLAPRDVSPAPDTQEGRIRSNSIKRKSPEDSSFAEVASRGTTDGYYSEKNRQVNELTLDIGKVKSIVEKVAVDIGNSDLDPGLIAIFGGICEAMQGICGVQQKIVLAGTNDSTVGGPVPVTERGPGTQTGRDAPVMVSLGAIPKKPRQGNPITPTQRTVPYINTVPSFNTAQAMSKAGSGTGAGETDPDPVRSAFKESIWEAERSTLIFNLDLGKVPVLNKDTMSKRATLALTTMAATKEKKTGSVPSSEAVDAIDDVLSIVKDMAFLGNSTKTYRKAGDDRSGGFCTVPVKYEFRDRDTKAQAERVLRKYCDVQCATPYPPMVRECIKQIVAESKKAYPDNFIRVTIDTQKMLFKVSRNAPDTSDNPGWHSRDVDIPIPTEAMDCTVKRPPRDFKLHIPPSPPQKS